jgi:hypothetical protein
MEVIKDCGSRQRIIEALELLSDFEKQQKEWKTPSFLARILNIFFMHFPIFYAQQVSNLAEANLEKRYWHSLNMLVLNILFDEFKLHKNSTQFVGQIFYDLEEAEQIHIFSQSLNSILKEIGEEKQDLAYIKSFQKHNVFKRARELFKLIESRNNIKS